MDQLSSTSSFMQWSERGSTRADSKTCVLSCWTDNCTSAGGFAIRNCIEKEVCFRLPENAALKRCSLMTRHYTDYDTFTNCPRSNGRPLPFSGLLQHNLAVAIKFGLLGFSGRFEKYILAILPFLLFRPFSGLLAGCLKSQNLGGKQKK
jgi:hypothetical protein